MFKLSNELWIYCHRWYCCRLIFLSTQYYYRWLNVSALPILLKNSRLIHIVMLNNYNIDSSTVDIKPYNNEKIDFEPRPACTPPTPADEHRQKQLLENTFSTISLHFFLTLRRASFNRINSISRVYWLTKFSKTDRFRIKLQCTLSLPPDERRRGAGFHAKHITPCRVITRR